MMEQWRAERSMRLACRLEKGVQHTCAENNGPPASKVGNRQGWHGVWQAWDFVRNETVAVKAAEGWEKRRSTPGSALLF